MIMKTYVLYIDNEKSVRYKNECLESAASYPELEMIPVQGYNGEDALELSQRLGINIIPHYRKQLEQGSREINNAFCCTMGHYKIWQMIAESNENGIVLEHDAVIKGPINLSDWKEDTDLVFLGYRILKNEDYRFPLVERPRVIPTDRFEGAHAYAITPETARKLIDYVEKYGFNDSLDGQMGMRNLFGLNFGILDPGPVVAVLADKDSCIESTGNPAQFNAPYTQEFLRASRDGSLLQVREVYLNKNVRFLESYQKISDKIKLFFSDRKIEAMIVGFDEGTIAYKVSNDALAHEDSQADVYLFEYAIELNGQKILSTSLVQYNLYFSWYYYKHKLILGKREDLDFPISRELKDLIFIDCAIYSSDEMFRTIMWANISLNRDGLAVFYCPHLKMSERHLSILRRNGVELEVIDNFIIVYK